MSGAPDRDEILERLRRVVQNKVDVDPLKMTPDARLADIGIDSFSLIELVFMAEDEFDISIPVEGLKVKSVADVLDVIEQRLANANA